MNSCIKTAVKTLADTRKKIASQIANLDKLGLASTEAATAACRLTELRTKREDEIATAMASNQVTDTSTLDDQITIALSTQIMLDDRQNAAKKAITLTESSIALLQAEESRRLDECFAAYCEDFQSMEQTELLAAQTALNEFRVAGAKLAALNEACSLLNRGAYSGSKEVSELLYSKVEHGYTLRDATKTEAQAILQTFESEIKKTLGLTFWQIKMKHPTSKTGAMSHTAG
jgi:hypothetical protein